MYISLSGFCPRLGRSWKCSCHRYNVLLWFCKDYFWHNSLSYLGIHLKRTCTFTLFILIGPHPHFGFSVTGFLYTRYEGLLFFKPKFCNIHQVFWVFDHNYYNFSSPSTFENNLFTHFIIYLLYLIHIMTTIFGSV